MWGGYWGAGGGLLSDSVRTQKYKHIVLLRFVTFFSVCVINMTRHRSGRNERNASFYFALQRLAAFFAAFDFALQRFAAFDGAHVDCVCAWRRKVHARIDRGCCSGNSFSGDAAIYCIFVRVPYTSARLQIREQLHDKICST